MALTDKQKRFCEEYVVDLNGTQAAIRAGYSEKGARVNAAKLLTKTNIQERISRLKEQRSEETGVTAEWVVQEIKKQYDIAVGYDDSPNALKALNMLGKHAGIYDKDNRQREQKITIKIRRDGDRN